MAKLLYEDEMKQVIGIAFAVRNELGAGWSEEIYHQAMVYMLAQQNVPFQSKPRRALIHQGVEVHTFEPDLIVRDKIILELKVLNGFRGKEFPKAHQAQILHYMKYCQMRVGMLINFTHAKVGLKRMIFTPLEKKVEENYEKMLPHVSENEKQTLREVQRCIVNLFEQYGLGYPQTIYRKLIAIELSHRGIDCVQDVHVLAEINNQQLGTHTTPCLLVAGKFLIQVISSANAIPVHEYLRVQTYLDALELKVGWVVNFGRKQLQIHATATQ